MTGALANIRDGRLCFTPPWPKLQPPAPLKTHTSASHVAVAISDIRIEGVKSSGAPPGARQPAARSRSTCLEA